jgi:hypothetical protein
MLIALIPLLFMVLGALVYALGNGKVAEMGRILFFCGLFFLTAVLANKTVRFF